MTLASVRPRRPSAWLAAPMLLCALASLIFALPVRVAGLQLPEPVFAMVPAFAWAAIRPSILAPFALLIVGAFLDLLWGAPLGLWPLCLMFAYAFTFTMRPSLSGQNFAALWAWYAAACMVGMAAGMVLTTLAAGVVPNLIGAAWQWLASAALFPAAHRLINRHQEAEGRFR